MAAHTHARGFRALVTILLIAITAGVCAEIVESIPLLGAAAQQTALLALTGLTLIALSVGLLCLCSIDEACEQTEQSQARAHDFAEVAADWYCSLDRELRVDYVSNRCFAQAGDWVGMPWLEAGLKFGFWCLSDANRNRLQGRQPFHDHRFRLTRENRVSHWSLSGKPVLDRRGQFAGYRIAARDITPLMRAQEELASARDIAERANRAKSSFMTCIGHELRTPLIAILGFADIIGQEMMGPMGHPKYIEYAHDIRYAANRLMDTLNNILDMSRIQAGHLLLREQEFALWDVLEAVLRHCRGQSRNAGVMLIANLPSALPSMCGDPLRIKQILIQLVSSALKLTPKGGRVTIETRRKSDGAFAIIVRDNGAGMDPEDIRRAMQPFEQLEEDRPFAGINLGLCIASMLASYHGGSLHIASAPGKGTVVTLTLPAARVPNRAIALPA